jgi:ATP-dependent Clp protease ATP-binding subunit ClpC
MATMLNQFSEPARRVIFWARYEAGRLGSDAIEPEHLLLGLLLEDQGESVSPYCPATARRPELFFSGEITGKLRLMLSESIVPGDPKPTNLDMPVARKARLVLIAAGQRAGTAKVQMVHILWALTSDGANAVGKLLNAHGITMEQVEAAIQKRDT